MSPLEKLFGKTAQLTVLEHLMKNKGEINYLSGIAHGTGLYHSSVARVLEPLLENNIVIERKIGKQIRSFSLNEEHKATKLLMKFYEELKPVLDDQSIKPEGSTSESQLIERTENNPSTKKNKKDKT